MDSVPKNIDELRKEVRNFILAYQDTLMRRSRWQERSMFALKAARMAVSASTVVVCDYNHLFIDGVREASLPSMGLTLEQTILIVDEAHNLQIESGWVLNVALRQQSFEMPLLNWKKCMACSRMMVVRRVVTFWCNINGRWKFQKICE